MADGAPGRGGVAPGTAAASHPAPRRRRAGAEVADEVAKLEDVELAVGIVVVHAHELDRRARRQVEAHVRERVAQLAVVEETRAVAVEAIEAARTDADGRGPLIVPMAPPGRGRGRG